MRRLRRPSLFCRNGTFYLRRRVPADLRKRFLALELKRSLATGDRPLAQARFEQANKWLDELFFNVRTAPVQLIASQLQQAVRDYFARLSEEVTFPNVPFGDPEAVDFENESVSDKIATLEEALRENAFTKERRLAAASLVGASELDWNELSVAQQEFVLRGMSRAQIEQARLFRYRLENETAPYVPADALFRSEPAKTSPTSAVAGKSISSLASQYIASREQGHWTPKTADAQKRVINSFVDFVGAGLPATEVTTQNVREFRDALLHLRRGFQLDGQPIDVGLTDEAELRVSWKTADKNLGFVKSFMKSLVDDGDLETAVGTSINVKPPTNKGPKARRPFTKDELLTLFSSPAFAGNTSVKYQSKSFYWILLLALHTGARLGELVQLRRSDIAMLDGVPAIRIRPSPATDESPKQRVKNDFSIRDVPIHPKLLELGFMNFVASTDSPGKRIFSDVPYAADSSASGVFSKRFAYYSSKIGLTDKTITFHSFRHTIEDEFRNLETPQYIINSITGRATEGSSGLYGLGASLPARNTALAKIDFSLPLQKA